MSKIIVYQCSTCNNTWENKKYFEEHAKKRNHLKCAVVKIPKSVWDDLKRKYPEEDEI